MNIDIQTLLDKALELAQVVGPKLLLAILVLAVGWRVVNYLVHVLERVFEKTELDEGLESFITSLASISMRIILVISVAGMLGFETTTLITVLGAMAFAVGMALQGSLGNLAGGVLILIFKPFRTGDFIEAQGHKGTVRSIQIFQTILRTPDNKQIVIPNGDLSNGAITNYSATGKRRLDMVFGIGYDDDLQKAKEILQTLAESDERVLRGDDHPIQIMLGNLADSAVEVYCRVWVKSDDYWPLKFDMQERVKAEFSKAGISIPYPQLDVYVSK
jgi:small conductance mechanosensitive channel